MGTKRGEYTYLSTLLAFCFFHCHFRREHIYLSMVGMVVTRRMEGVVVNFSFLGTAFVLPLCGGYNMRVRFCLDRTQMGRYEDECYYDGTRPQSYALEG